MKGLRTIIETKDGCVIDIGYGETYILDDGQEITYEQVMKWLAEGSLKQHGFCSPKICCLSEPYDATNCVVHKNTDLATIGAIIAATI